MYTWRRFFWFICLSSLHKELHWFQQIICLTAHHCLSQKNYSLKKKISKQSKHLPMLFTTATVEERRTYQQSQTQIIEFISLLHCPQMTNKWGYMKYPSGHYLLNLSSQLNLKLSLKNITIKFKQQWHKLLMTYWEACWKILEDYLICYWH